MLDRFVLERYTVLMKKKPKKDRNPHAVALGRLGGLKGGKARANRLSPERLAEIAKMGGKARWTP